jgi:hypothetical protein
MSNGITSRISCAKVSNCYLAFVTTGGQWLTPAAAGEVLFADVLLLPNGMSKVG